MTPALPVTMIEQDSVPMIPLYGLFYIEGVSAFEDHSQRTLATWNDSYSKTEMEGVQDAIRLAIAQNGYDFHSILH